MRRALLAVLLALLPLGAGPFVPPLARDAAAAPLCFPQNGRCADGAFRDYWAAHGGLEIIGLPLGQAFVDDRGLLVQYYERAILEWHPENPPAYEVLLTRLGDARLGARPERTAPAKACPPGATDCALLAPTGHTLRGAFLAYWGGHGGLAAFGYPLTEEITEANAADGKPYTVQYFERNRFEYHPENAGTPYTVLLGLLGGEAWRANPTLAGRPAAPTPEGTRAVGLPTRLTIPTIGVDGAIAPVGVDATNTMESPADPYGVAWYKYGARPGGRGSAVLAGHVDYAGIGPVIFWNLRSLTPGAELFVADDAGRRWRFVVTANETYRLDQFPGQRVFGDTGETALNLITCDGDFDPLTRSYDRRTVVYARWDGIVPPARP
jgi:sortase (surface protein transpeptidase)